MRARLIGLPSEHRSADVSDTAGASRTPASRDGPVPSGADSVRQARVAQAIEHRAIVDDIYRASAIDQAYKRVRDIERGTVTSAMKREAEDPEQRFELQFHTQSSLDAKEETHWAYEKLRVGVQRQPSSVNLRITKSG
jgi:hypothetical protein